MSYASAAARHRPNLQGQRPAVAVNPLRHLSHLQGLSLLIDLKAVRPNNTKVERADFVLKDLEVEAGEVLSIFVDHVTQLLILTLESEAAYNTTLQRLHAGVPRRRWRHRLWLLLQRRCVCSSSLQHPPWPPHPFCFVTHAAVWNNTQPQHG